MDEHKETAFLMLLLHRKKQRRLHRMLQQLKRRPSARIGRLALQHSKRSAFIRLFNSKDDSSLIALCGFDHASFQKLLELFAPVFNEWTPYPQTASNTYRMRRLPRSGRTGRKRLINATICLALVLAWTRTRGATTALQVIFGMTATPVSVWLRFGRRVLVTVLKDHPDAMVQLPTSDEVATFKRVINEKYPVLTNVWGAMDGLKLLIEANPDLESMFYNGWKCDHYISNLFVFSPDGRIRASYINAPGSWHDSTMAVYSKTYEKLDHINAREQACGGARIVVDSAFGSEARESLLKSYQRNTDRQGRVRRDSEIHKAATSVRQLSEWGMQGLQASFPRLKDRLRYEEFGERKVIVSLIVLLYNFRASTVGFNQISSTFYPNLLYVLPWFGRHRNIWLHALKSLL